MELKINGLTKEFKDFRAVDHVSCSMERGVYGLLGVNGAARSMACSARTERERPR